MYEYICLVFSINIIVQISELFYIHIYINKILYPNKLCYIKTHIIEKYKRVKMKIKYEKLILINLLKVFNILKINCLFNK